MPSVQAVRSSEVLLTLGPVAGRGSPPVLGTGFSGLVSGYLDAAGYAGQAGRPDGATLPAAGESLPQTGGDAALAASADSDAGAILDESENDMLAAIALDAEHAGPNTEAVSLNGLVVGDSGRVEGVGTVDTAGVADDLRLSPGENATALSDLDPGVRERFEAALGTSPSSEAVAVIEASEQDSAEAADRLSHEALAVRTDPLRDPAGTTRAMGGSGDVAERVAGLAEHDRNRRADAASQVDRRQNVAAEGEEALLDKLDPRRPVADVEVRATTRDAPSLQGASLQAASLQTAPLHGALQRLSGGGVRPNGEAAVALGMPRGLGGESWSRGVSDRMVWMVGQKVQVAELRLDPPELGSLQVRLTLTQDQASVSFISPHAHVRDALEQQMPRLREMLQEGGVDLGQADVSDQSPGNTGRESDSDGRSGGGDSRWASTTALDGGDEAVSSKSLSLVDYYA